MSRHHPGEAHLAAYAGGGMAEAPALLIATHLALCPLCRRRVADYEALGGSLLDELPPAPVDADSLARTFARIDRASSEPPGPVPPPLPAALPPGLPLLPRPLRDYVAGPSARLVWRSPMPGLKTLSLPVAGAKVWLMRLGPGRPLPQHSHSGREMVLVLEGSYRDGAVGYGPGDVQISGPEVLHRPVADTDGPCLCLAVIEGRFRLQSRFGRLMAPLLGY